MGNTTFQNTLVILRSKSGLTQEQAAMALEDMCEELGIPKNKRISRSSLANYESGKREPDFYRLKLLAKFYGVDFNELLSQTEIIGGFETKVYPVGTLTKHEIKLIETYRKLPIGMQGILSGYAQGLYEGYKSKPGVSDEERDAMQEKGKDEQSLSAG